MKPWTSPTDEQLAQIETLAARPENRAYFFDRLENPEWVLALAQRGFFDEPPDPVPADEPGYLRFPPWPEGRYLVRVASDAPDEVLSVLYGQSQTSNPDVTRILLEAAQALPNEQVQRLASRVVEWIEAPFADYFADEAASAITRLLDVAETEQSIKAVRALLKLESRPDVPEAPGEAARVFGLKPSSRLSDWQYERVVATVLPNLVDQAGLNGVAVFSSLLDDALEFARAEGEAPDSDGHSFLWRPAIEDHVQNADRGIRNLLVSAVRDAALRLVPAGESELKSSVLMLETGTVIHRRIALHILANVSGGAELATDRLTNRGLFDDYRLKHEYAALLRGRFGDAPLDGQRTVLDWIVAGPDLEEYRQRRSSLEGQPPCQEDETTYAAIWQRDWLSFIADDLTGDEAVLYQALVQSHGEPDHPDFLSWSSSWIGAQSPLTSDEMGRLLPAEVIEYLRVWRPEDDSGWHFGPSMEGLGQAFKDAVLERPMEFAKVADQLVVLDPTYVRNFLQGLEEAVKDGVSIPWDQPVHLLAAVVQHPFEVDEEVPDRDRDPGWRWTRREVASLIRTGISDRGNQIPFEMRHDVWHVIERLTSDPNPSPSHEVRYGGDNMDPFTLSINTNRGVAIHSVIEYSLWCRRELDARGVDVVPGFDLIPEARDVLQDHLDPDSDPSLAIRSVYGRWLPWLLLLDERWVTENIVSILPHDPELTAFRDAAWDTYIGWCPPYDSVYEALQAQYAAAVERVPAAGTIGVAHDERADEKLGDHLATFFWRDVISRTLLDRLFELGNDELAGHVMEFIGRALQHTEGEVPHSVRQRIEELWDVRLAAIRTEPGVHQREAQAFASTFVSGKVDEEWSLGGLEVAVQSAEITWLGGRVIAQLAEVAVAWPAVATRLTLAMLHGNANDWDHVGWRDEVRTLLSVTSEDPNDETLRNRSAIVDFYVSRGELDFRALI